MQEGEVSRPELIDQVREGMTVVDVADERLGTVAYVRRGDPRAVAPASGDDEPAVPEPERSELLRCGFIKIEGPDLSDTDRYVKGDRIAAVSGDTVRLTLLVSGTVTG